MCTVEMHIEQKVTDIRALADYNQAILLIKMMLGLPAARDLYQEIGEVEKASADFREPERVAQREFPTEGKIGRARMWSNR